MLKIILIISVIFSSSAFCNIESKFSQYKNFIHKKGNMPLAAMNNFNPKKVIKHYTDNPNQKKYYSKPNVEENNLSKHAKGQLQNDKAGGYVYENKDKINDAEINVASEQIDALKVIENKSGEILKKNGGVFCLNGNCVEKNKSENKDFNKNITKLAAVGQAGFDYKKSAALLFLGHARTCVKRPVGFLDCCSDKGWGKDLKIAKCRQEDKSLGIAKKKYLAHYIGEYCAHWFRWPGGKTCTERKRTYCVFNSKMGRIVQEEGRLRRNSSALGTAKNPSCNGITAAQLAKIDLGGIDFVNPVYPYGSGIHNPDAGIAGDIKSKQPSKSDSSSKIESQIESKSREVL